MDDSSLLPVLVVVCVLCGLRARIDVYDAFVCGAREGLMTLVQMAPYLCAVLMASRLIRETGVLAALEAALAPALEAAGLPRETAGVVLLRPLSGSASLSAVQDIMRVMGPDSRASRVACVISASSETLFFTGSLYLGAAGVKGTRYAFAAALAAYAAGVMAAGLIIP